MNSRISLGGLCVLILGLVAALGPQYIFPACEKLVTTQAGHAIPMKCHWTAMAVTGDGLLVIVAGLILALAKNPGLRLGASVMTICAGLLAVLTPSVLIGCCKLETMPCRMTMSPAIYLIGGLAVVLGVLLAIGAMKANSSQPKPKRG